MNYALVILCGGNSVRMGTDKALLPFGDCCLLEYLVHKFKPYFSTIYLSVKYIGDYAHLNLPVTEIADIYGNAGPMSVDTPFMEPETGIALLDAIGDADICMVRGKAGYLDPATAAYSKNCIPTIGKSLILRQFTFDALREKCKTVCVTEKALAACTDIPVDRQFFNLDTRQDYYQALKIYLQL